QMGGAEAKLYSTDNSDLKTKALKSDLHLLDAQVRHLGTDRNLKILANIYEYLQEKVDIKFKTEVLEVQKDNDNFSIVTNEETFTCRDLVLATGRSGSKWISSVCQKLGIKSESNRVDIGVRVELPARIFSHITDEVYESKIVYRTRKYNDLVRTFCMNPYGEVVTENTNGIITVNGHSYSDPKFHTENTNFALLVSNQFTEPFKNSNEYGESIARLSNMLGGGVLIQRFADLVNGRRTNERRMAKSFTRPTLNATPGDLSLVIPKRQLDDIIEMIYALDKIAPGTANEDTLLYGVEVKFYNSKVQVDDNLETIVEGLYVLGDSSGVTHSLSQASASGVYVGRILGNK
ncbi:MAG: FAD-dependent oxidoreductase, partial [Bacillota bacterium]|nr:FAD-dependent oxidoreductase [Bacillota bacterium]